MTEFAKNAAAVQKQLKEVVDECDALLEKVNKMAKDDPKLIRLGLSYITSIISSIEVSQKDVKNALIGISWIVRDFDRLGYLEK